MIATVKLKPNAHEIDYPPEALWYFSKDLSELLGIFKEPEWLVQEHSMNNDFFIVLGFIVKNYAVKFKGSTPLYMMKDHCTELCKIENIDIIIFNKTIEYDNFRSQYVKGLSPFINGCWDQQNSHVF